MAESRESVEAEAEAGAEASAVESEVLCPDKMSGEVSDSGTSTSLSASAGTTTSGSQEQQPQQQHLPSYSRQTRNMMEKHRRDKMNAHINSLAQLVPTVANAPKKMDKTSILRLTAAYLRLHKFLNADAGGYVARLQFPRYLKDYDMYQALMEVMDGFMIIVSRTGNILFVTHTVETLLGHPQSYLMGQKLHSITFHEDHDVLNKNLTPDSEPSSSDHDGSGQMSVGDDNSSSGDTSSSSQSTPSPQQPSSSTSSVPANTSRNPSPDHQRRSFYVRLSQRTASRSDVTQYELVHIQGFLRVPQHTNPGPSVQARTRSRSRVTHHIMQTSIEQISFSEHPVSCVPSSF